MRLSRAVGSNLRACLVAASVVVGLAHCSGSSTGPGSGSSGNPAGGGSGSSSESGSSLGGGGGSSESGGATSGGLEGSGSATTGSSTTGSAGPTSGSSGSSSTGSATTGSAAPSGDGGTMTSAEGGTALSNCVSADTKACNSFTTPTGTMIQLGPYGAQMDVNVGKGWENTVPASDMPPQPSSTCQSFANLFGEDPKLTMQLLTTTMNGITVDFSLYSVYRPAIWPSGPIPVITWGNGTCAQPEGYGALLRYVASYGYFVVAANMRQVGTNNTTGMGNAQPMLRALDFAQAANKDSTSPYYQKLDFSKVGAMGHSQGGAATAAASVDSRITSLIIFNGLNAGSSSKPYWTISGDMDIAQSSESAFTSSVTSATAPGAWEWYHMPAGMGSLRGHLVLMLTPERVTKPTVAWWEWQFRNDAASKQLFLPSGSCSLCSMATSTGVGDADYGVNSLLK